MTSEAISSLMNFLHSDNAQKKFQELMNTGDISSKGTCRSPEEAKKASNEVQKLVDEGMSVYRASKIIGISTKTYYRYHRPKTEVCS